MSTPESISESRDITTSWCPGCTDDPPQYYTVYYCWRHQLQTNGSEDDAVTRSNHISVADIDSATNRAFCNGIHRGKWPSIHDA